MTKEGAASGLLSGDKQPHPERVTAQTQLGEEKSTPVRMEGEPEPSRTRYWDLYHLAPVGYVMLDEQGTILEANVAIAKQLRIAKAAVIGRPLQDFIIPEDHADYLGHQAQLLAGSASQVAEMRLSRAGDGIMWARIEATRAYSDEYRAAVCHVVVSDISERKQIEDAQIFLLQRGYAGEDFFRSLARYLGHSLNMAYVCIDRLSGEDLNAHTVAVYYDGHFEDNLTYSLKDTPCGDVVGKTICCFEQGVQHLFPKDAVLQEMKAESYVGTTLWDSTGQVIGLIALIGRQPLENRRVVESVLKWVAIRAAGELERQKVEASLRASLAEKEALLQEVHHRVKNNLASIVSLISLQLQTESDPSVIAKFTDLSQRVRSMTLVHELLYESEGISQIDMAEYLEALVSRLSLSYGRSARVRLQISAQGVAMGLDAAIPCGLIVNELVTNALKYAFPDTHEDGGPIVDEITVAMTWDGHTYGLTIHDNGQGLTSDWEWDLHQSLGLQIVKLLIEHQLGGTIELDRSAGTTFRLNFPPVMDTYPRRREL